MSKINFLKPDKDNLTTFLYMGSFLFVISVIDVFLNSFFSLNITGFLPASLSFIIPIILGFIGLYFIRIEHSGNKFLDKLNKNINTSNFNAILSLLIIFIIPFFSEVDAKGKGRKQNPKFRSSQKIGIRYIAYPGFGYNSWFHNDWRYHNFTYDPFWDSSFRSSIERDFELADVDQIFKQVVKLKEMKEKGIITAKEYDKVKKRLIDRVGKLIPSNKLKNSSDAIIQLEKIYLIY